MQVRKQQLDLDMEQRNGSKLGKKWVLGRADAEAEAPVLWSPEVKSWLTGKDPDAGKDWRQEEKGRTEDEKVGWHHRLDGHEFEQALGVGDGQGGLKSCSPWGYKELDMTDWLNWLTDFELKISNLLGAKLFKMIIDILLAKILAF